MVATGIVCAVGVRIWHNREMSESTKDTTVQVLWIEPSWLLWECTSEGRWPVSTDGVHRPYEMEQHSRDRLAGDPSDLDRVDAITTLKRAVDHRVRMLKKIYGLRQLSKSLKTKDDLELLASFDIVRPFMLRRLIAIRNIVEHEDSKPPSTSDCLMFTDLVWYFLRSTDALVRAQLDDLVFYTPGSQPFVYRRKFSPTVKVTFPESFNGSPEVDAWLTPASFSYETKTDWIRIEASEIDKYEMEEPPRWRISGKMLASGEQMRLFYQAYFIEHMTW